MHCQITVRFAPDSLADYDDVVTIVAEDGSVFPVRLQGRRPPPILTLAHNLDTGVCLIGAHKVTTFTCTNLGGKGRFILIPEDTWPEIPQVAPFDDYLNGGGEEEGKESMGNGGGMEKQGSVLSIPPPPQRAGSVLSTYSRDADQEYGLPASPFIISPHEFELEEGQSIDIRIGYVPRGNDLNGKARPEDMIEDSVTLQMVCDNCQVKSFTVTGLPALPMLELCSVDDKRALGSAAFVSDSNEGGGVTRRPKLDKKGALPSPNKGVSFRLQPDETIGLDDEGHEAGLRIKAPVPVTTYHAGSLSGFPLPLEKLIFRDLAVGAVQDRTVTVKNIIGHPVSYRWECIALSIDKDLPTPAFDMLSGGSNTQTKGESLTLEGDASSVFTISPSTGVFDAEAEVTFEVKFAPDAVGSFTTLARLVVENVPKLSISHQQGDSDGEKEGEETVRGMTDATMLSVRFDGTGVPCKLDLQPSYLPFGSSLVSGQSQERKVKLRNTTGARTKFNFSLPSASQAGRLRAKRQVPGKKVEDSTIFVEVSPKEGVLEAEEEIEVVVKATPQVNGARGLHKDPSQFFHQLRVVCNVEHGDSIELLLEGSINGPSIAVEDMGINFGLIRYNKGNAWFDNENETTVVPITLKNTGTSPGSWTLHVQSQVLGKGPTAPGSSAPRGVLEGELRFEPNQGDLDGGETTVVNAIFEAKSAGSLRGSAVCVVSDGGIGSVVPVRAEIIEPKLCLTPPVIDLDTCYVSVQKMRTVTLRNLTRHRTAYSLSHDDNDILHEKEMEASDEYSAYSSKEAPISIAYYPYKGVLEPMEEKEIEVSVLFRRAGELDAIALGYADGMGRPLALNVKGKVEDLNVSFKVLDASGSEIELHTKSDGDRPANAQVQDGVVVPKIDFGSNLPILKPVTRTLVITNETNIPTSYLLEVKNFPGAVPDEEIVTALTTSLGLDASKVGAEGVLTQAAKTNMSQKPPRAGTRGRGTANEAIDGGLEGIAKSLGTSRAFAEGLMGTLTSTLGGTHATGKSSMGKGGTSSIRRRRLLLTDDNEKARPYASVGGQTHTAQKNLDRLQRAILSTGNGAAIVPSPEIGDLGPYSTVEIPITLYTDAAGRYLDRVTVTVGHLRPFEVHVRADVLGSPLQILDHTMGLNYVQRNNKDEVEVASVSDGNGTGEGDIEAVMDFGSFLRGKKLTTRAVRVVNRGRSDALLQWKIFRESTVKSNPLLSVKLKDTGVVFEDEMTNRSVESAVAENMVQLRIKPRTPVDIVEEIQQARSSGGEEPEQVFFFDPPEAVIPPYSETSFNVSFKSEAAGFHLYRFIGCVTLLEKNIKAAASEGKRLKSVKTQALDPRPGTKFVAYPQQEAHAAGARLKAVREVTGVHAPPVVVSCKALSTKASLATGDRERLAFHTNACMPLESETYCKDLTLTNNTESSLEFAFEVEGTFSIIATSTAAPAHPLAIRDNILTPPASPGKGLSKSGVQTPRQPTLIFSLPPRASVTATLRFDPYSRKPPSRDKAKPLVEQGHLKVAYANEDMQLFPLEGTLVYPAIVPIKGAKKVRGGYLLEFGEIHVDTPKTLSIVLRNPTTSDATFKVVSLAAPKPGSVTQPGDMIKRGAFGDPPEEVKKPSADPSVFSMSHMSGTVKGSKLYPEELTFEITFKPQVDDEYDCRFRMQVSYGCGFDITLKGKGSYLEEKDAFRHY